MAQKYKVVQWATGVVGSAALRGIVRHPKLELVGVKVYSDDKKGRDAGDIVGIDNTGVIATQDVGEIMALDVDCVIYCPLPWDLGEICRLLESGIHVITPCPYWFPFIQNPEVAASIGAACKKGNVNMHASGCNPGGIAGRTPPPARTRPPVGNHSRPFTRSCSELMPACQWGNHTVHPRRVGRSVSLFQGRRVTTPTRPRMTPPS